MTRRRPRPRSTLTTPPPPSSSLLSFRAVNRPRDHFVTLALPARPAPRTVAGVWTAPGRTAYGACSATGRRKRRISVGSTTRDGQLVRSFFRCVSGDEERARTNLRAVAREVEALRIGAINLADQAQVVKMLEDTGLTNLLPGVEEDTKAASAAPRTPRLGDPGEGRQR